MPRRSRANTLSVLRQKRLWQPPRPAEPSGSGRTGNQRCQMRRPLWDPGFPDLGEPAEGIGKMPKRINITGRFPPLINSERAFHRSVTAVHNVVKPLRGPARVAFWPSIIPPILRSIRHKKQPGPAPYRHRPRISSNHLFLSMQDAYTARPASFTIEDI